MWEYTMQSHPDVHLFTHPSGLLFLFYNLREQRLAVWGIGINFFKAQTLFEA